MPTAAFIVTLNLSEVTASTLESAADSILDDLSNSGHDVEDVQPWSHPALNVGQPASAPFQAPPPDQSGLLGPGWL